MIGVPTSTVCPTSASSPVTTPSYGEGSSTTALAVSISTIVASVRRTGRCVVVHEAPVTGGLGAEIAARVTEACFYQLEAPVLRVGGFSVPYPPSRLEEHYLPDLDRVLDAVDRTFAY